MPALIVIVLFAGFAGTVIWLRNGARQRFRERGWALFILLIGTLLIIGQLLRWPIPNPTDWLTVIFSPIYKPIARWIKEDL